MFIKTTSTTSTKSEGSTLLITLVIAGLIGMTLIAYLKMTSNQNYFVARSQSWNVTIPVIEAGLEEALTHLNRNGTTNVNLTADGWSLVDGVYTKANYVGPNYYIVTIAFGIQPEIISQGYTPLQINYTSGGGPFFAAAGDSGSILNSYVYRTVKVTTSADAMFAKGMVAKSKIDLNGNNIHTDSFDSTDPLLSTFGLYDPTKARDNGDIATNSSLTNSVMTGNANIWGHISTGPNGSISIGPNGVAGSKAWALNPSNLGKIQPGWFADDMNVSFPPVHPPFSGGTTPNPGNYNGDHYNYLIDGGNFILSSLKITGQKDLIVTGPSILWITGDLTLSGSGQITITPGASLKLYVGQTTGSGTTASIGGNGIVNGSGNATNFFYYGLPRNTSLSYSGNATFTGAVYAPNADFTLGGGGGDIYDFIGASVTSTVKMNGHFKFHYDENLGKIGPRRGYIAISWDEIASGPLTPPASFTVK